MTELWKASIGKEIKNGSGGGDDDWETDPDFVNDVSEKESRWGAKTIAGSGHQESVDINELRQQALHSDKEQKKRQLEIMPKPSLGYGGKFGVEKDRMDKSAETWQYKGQTEKHVSQKDYAHGFGGKFGVETDRQDKSAFGWEHKESVPLHESQKDYVKGFGGKFGVQKDRQDKSAVGWEHKDELSKHESQKDYAKGFGGKYGVQSDRQDKCAAGWDYEGRVEQHPSQKDYSKGFGGKFGVEADRKDKSAVGWEHREELSKHESQKDYAKGFGGKFGVEAGRQDKNAVGWEHKESVPLHQSQKDYAKGFGGKFGVEADRQDKSAAGWTDRENSQQKAPVSAASDNAVSIEKGRASNLRARFEQLAAKDPDEEKKRIAEEQERRRRQDQEEQRKQKQMEEDRQMRLKETQGPEEMEETNELHPSRNYAEDSDTVAPVSPQPTSPTRVAHQLLPAHHKHGHAMPVGAVPVMPLHQPTSPSAHTADLKQALAQSMRRPPTPPSDEEPDAPTYTGTVEPAQVVPSVGHGYHPARDSVPDDEFNAQQHRQSDNYEEPLHQEQQRKSIHEHPLAQPTHPMADTGMTAVALYDYQAGDDDEISFEPDDIITNIEMVDAGWWRGECRGKYGLFPANYVEMRPQ